jgi:uncharacterized protein (TIGR00369 family)
MSDSDLVFPALPGIDIAPVFQDSRSPMGQNIGLVYMGFGDKRICTGLKWHQRLVGNAETDVLHGGVVTAMIDETAGGASVLATDHKFSVATVDLRVDYMRPAAPRQNLYCTAHIYRLTERIAFFNAQAFNDDPAKPIAVGTGTFLLGANDSVPDILGSPFKAQEDG